MYFIFFGVCFVTSDLDVTLTPHLYWQELIKNKAKSGQSCSLLETSFSMVSSLPWRSDCLHQVSLIENYPAPLTALGEPVRQVTACVCFDITTQLLAVYPVNVQLCFKKLKN